MKLKLGIGSPSWIFFFLASVIPTNFSLLKLVKIDV